MYNENGIAPNSAREIDIDGKLRVAMSNISKETVNPYYGYEIPNWEGLGLEREKVYFLYRPGDELAKAATSFNGVQIVETHTPMYADDPKREVVIGATGTDALFEAPYLKNSLVFWDADAIAKIEAADQGLGGAKQLSCGYAYEAVMEPGEFEGQRYDGRMINIIGNHVALVEMGRAGYDVKVADKNPFIDEGTMKKKAIIKKSMSKLKAMDIDISPEQLDSLLDVVLGVEQGTETDTDTSQEISTPVPITSEDVSVGQSPMEAAKSMLSDKGFSADEIDKLCGMISGAQGQQGMDEDKDNKDSDDDKDDEKKETKGEDEKEDMKEEKQAMDAVAKNIEEKIRTQFMALDQAKSDVRNIIGDVFNVNSPDEVYRLALDHLSIDHKNIKEISALKALCKVGNERTKTTESYSSMAQDIGELIQEFPNVARIKI